MSIIQVSNFNIGRVLSIICGVLIAVSCTTGCKSYRYAGAPPPSYDVDADLKQLTKHFSPAISISNYYALGTNATPRDRNEVISGRLVMINLEYLRWLRTMTADKQLLDTASDVLILSLNLAATATGGATAKTVLSAISAGITGSKTAIDKHYYYDKTLPALVSAMNAQRKTVLTNLLAGMSKPLTDYTFEQALADLQDYYQAGTLLGAVTAVQADAGAKEKEADEGVKRAQITLSKVRRKAFVDPNTQKRVDALLDKIKNLRDDAAISLEKNPPVRDPETDNLIALRGPPRDPSTKNITEGKIAKEMLKLRVVLGGERSEEDLSAWEAALKAAE